MKLATFENDTLTINAGGYAQTIKVSDIAGNFNNLSHFPDRRATGELISLGNRLNVFGEFLAGLSAMGQIDSAFNADDEAETYTRRNVALTRDYWNAESRCASAFIVGPARFPTARNQKRMSASDNKRDEINRHTEAALKAVKRRAFPHGADGEAIRSNDPQAVEKITAKIAGLREDIENSKAANKLIRSMTKAGQSDEAIVAAIVEQVGIPREIATRAVILPPHLRGFPRGFDTVRDNAEIKRLEARLVELERMKASDGTPKTVATRVGAVEIVENAEAARIQMLFPDKPDEETRNLLKRYGFRWSPRESAWQRHLNANGRDAVAYVLKSLAA